MSSSEYITHHFGKMVPITHLIDRATFYVKQRFLKWITLRWLQRPTCSSYKCVGGGVCVIGTSNLSVYSFINFWVSRRTKLVKICCYNMLIIKWLDAISDVASVSYSKNEYKSRTKLSLKSEYFFLLFTTWFSITISKRCFFRTKEKPGIVPPPPPVSH